MGTFRIDVSKRAGMLMMMGMFAACSRQPTSPIGADRISVIDSNAAATSMVELASAPEKPATVIASAPPRMQPYKTFADPPLPPELQNDGGLVPFPPAPTPTPSFR